MEAKQILKERPQRCCDLDVGAIREDFPILKRLIYGKPLIYLDSAATTQRPTQILEAMCEYCRYYNSNIHRGIYTISEEATAKYEGARKKLANFINARSPKEVIFVRNATEAINLVAYSWGRANVGPGDEIILSEMEHHSNLVPWQQLAKEKGAKLKFIPIDEEGLLRLDQMEVLLSDRTKLLAITHMSNVLGTINPVKEIVKRARSVGAATLIDGAQSVPHLGVDVRDIGCDFLAFSGHKMLGPTGIGALYGRRELLEEMPPFLTGGDMIIEVHFSGAKWNELPWKFEAGTPSIAEGIALGAAVDYLAKIGLDRIRQHEKDLVEYTLARLDEMGKIKIYGPRDPELRGGVVAFNIEGMHPHDLASILDREGICIRAGHHCAQPLLERLGVKATARASFYIYNTEEEVDALVDGINKARKIFEL